MNSLLKMIDYKPSKAVEYMVDGLLEQSSRDDFEVEMCTYGGYSEQLNICYGCAATCTVQAITGVSLNEDNIGDTTLRCRAMGVTQRELGEFESAINRFRRGNAYPLLSLCGVEHWEEVRDPDIYLRSKDWREQLPVVREYIEYLKNLGY